MFVWVARRRDMIRFKRSAVTRSAFRELMGAAAGVGLRTVGLLAAFSGATAVAARVGDDAVAAHRVVDQLFLFLALSVDALAVAAQAMLGKRLGADDGPGARGVVRRRPTSHRRHACRRAGPGPLRRLRANLLLLDTGTPHQYCAGSWKECE